MTDEYKAQLVQVARQRPRSLGQPYSLWTCQRLADYMAEQTGIRVSGETGPSLPDGGRHRAEPAAAQDHES